MSDAEILGPNDPGPRESKDANFSDQTGRPGPGAEKARPFPWERLAFTVLFAFIAWFAFWISLVLAAVGGALKLFGVQTQDNIASYARRSTAYLASALSYVSGETDEKPFPFG